MHLEEFMKIPRRIIVRKGVLNGGDVHLLSRLRLGDR